MTSMIKKHIPKWEYVGQVNQIHWSSWECPDDGIIVFDFDLTTSAGIWYYYVTDATQNVLIARSSGTNANGTGRTMTFPVIKGHTYKQSAFANINGSVMHFYYYKFVQ